MLRADGGFGEALTLEMVTALLAVVIDFEFIKSAAIVCVVVFCGRICVMLTARGGMLSNACNRCCTDSA